jgi:hypothetical protein
MSIDIDNYLCFQEGLVQYSSTKEVVIDGRNKP